MKCQRCNKNEATAYIKKNINGVISETALCADCARETGQLDMNFGFSDIFSNLFSEFINPNTGFIGETLSCPVCHSTFSDIVQSGKVGCASCYNIFSDQLMPTIRSFQQKTIHSGKRPNGKIEAVKKEKSTNELDNLEKELKDAIKAQNFEYAAELRDKIKNLKESEGK